MLYGLDIGGTKIELAVFNEQQQAITSKRIPTPTDSYDTFLSSIQQLISDMDAELSVKGKVGIGIPGFINPSTGLVQCANVPCTNGKPLQADLERVLERPIKIENDANCFALSEAVGGAGDNAGTVLGLILGTGFGGGIVMDKKLHDGENNLAGEVGHTPLPWRVFQLTGDDFPIVQCGCGMHGCLDSYLSGRGLELIYQYYSKETRKGKGIVELYRNNDTVAKKSVDTYCELLASSLGALTNTLDPGAIVFGGGLSNFSELYELVPPLLKKYALSNGKLPEIKKAVFGDSGGVRGAAMLNI
ncbi:N-acetylglucosamine kinase [Endozoicomonas sp. OPT23]|uniref:N-acetylglucosamine kinase n=1 Tax=Endozoicomonas sp. OPT23 TaxID=2072845 RepID=UPI00129B3A2E|nr:N-acetylglucosamine kinase [Endozoicomonas sp. OPT23]MRI32331.1 N-acetylglucosamine kinase [Endozoicomonas sp. OPT23]